MLTLQEIQAELGRLSSFPDWSFAAWQHQFEGVWLTILAKNVPDSYHPGQTVDLGIHSPLPPLRDIEQLHEWLEWRLSIISRHEVREWFKRDGIPVYDPHREGVNEPPYEVLVP